MKVLVDTAVWSLAFRRQNTAAAPVVAELTSLIEDGRVAMIGPIRQELLSGIREEAQFARLRKVLRAFPDLEVLPDDYEEAAAMFNTCRRRGVQGSNTDYLLCAVSRRTGFPIFTTDADFDHFSKLLAIPLHGRR